VADEATRPFDRRRPVPTGDILQTQPTARSIVEAVRRSKPPKVDSVQKREFQKAKVPASEISKGWGPAVIFQHVVPKK
jgi:hypothetical protein